MIDFDILTTTMRNKKEGTAIVGASLIEVEEFTQQIIDTPITEIVEQIGDDLTKLRKIQVATFFFKEIGERELLKGNKRDGEQIITNGLALRIIFKCIVHAYVKSEYVGMGELLKILQMIEADDYSSFDLN